MPADPNETPNSRSQDMAEADELLRSTQEKDSVIEALRLELAEFHLKAAEHEHIGDSQLHMLERQVTDYKLQNARLQEENESFQMLLSEKTLKGDFLTESRSLEDTTGMSNLAEELESANDDPDTQTEAYKRLEAELKAAKEENKGLTLYVDKIIGRILQHEGFEHIIVNAKDDKSMPPPPPSKPTPKPIEKDLPPPPPAQDDSGAPTAAASVSNAAQGFLKRAGSLMSRSGNARPSRPISYAQPVSTPTANENPQTAPSIPLTRGHRRARSDQAQQDLGAAAVVQQMNRGSPLRTVSGGAMSPGVSPLSPSLQPRSGYFPNAPPTSNRAPSGQTGGHSSRNSITIEFSGRSWYSWRGDEAEPAEAITIGAGEKSRRRRGAEEAESRQLDGVV
jgi:hypothetical protein